MGEAKRRRKAGLGFDPNQKLITGCYIAPAMISDRHTVYIGIRKKSNSAFSAPISVHENITDAWKSLTHCKEILKTCSFSRSESEQEVLKVLKEKVVAAYGNQGEEGDRYQISGNINAFNAWMSEGNWRDKDNVPEGVIIIPLTKLVKKRYKVYVTPLKDESPQYYGNPEDNSVFHVGESFDHPIAGTKNELFIWQSYVIAGFFADYLNLNNKDSLSAEEAQRLTHEVQDLMNQERSPGVTIGGS